MITSSVQSNFLSWSRGFFLACQSFKPQLGSTLLMVAIHILIPDASDSITSSFVIVLGFSRTFWNINGSCSSFLLQFLCGSKIFLDLCTLFVQTLGVPSLVWKLRRKETCEDPFFSEVLAELLGFSHQGQKCSDSKGRHSSAMAMHLINPLPCELAD